MNVTELKNLEQAKISHVTNEQYTCMYKERRALKFTGFFVVFEINLNSTLQK